MSDSEGSPDDASVDDSECDAEDDSMDEQEFTEIGTLKSHFFLFWYLP